jgi:hypothetical protein
MNETTNETTQKPTEFERSLKRVLRMLRANAVAARLNVQQCCRGCVTPQQLGMADAQAPVVWHYGGQGRRLYFLDGVPHEKTNSRADGDGYAAAKVIYFNHDNGGAQKFLALCALHGITAKWSGREFDCVEIFPLGENA